MSDTNWRAYTIAADFMGWTGLLSSASAERQVSLTAGMVSTDEYQQQLTGIQ